MLGVGLASGCAAPPSPSGGITGTVLAGPACPGPVRVGSACPDRPISLQLAFLKDGAQVASVTSSADGRFKVDLAPGRYVIRGTGSGLPSVRTLTVDVPPGAYLEVAVSADTGIR